MVTVNITGFLTDFTNGVSGIELKSSPATVREALNELWQMHVGLRDRVVTEQGQLRQHVNIFLDGENVRRKELLETPVSENGEITILPSVSGGLYLIADANWIDKSQVSRKGDRDLRPETLNLKPKTKNQKPKTKDQKSYESHLERRHNCGE